jgi:sugar phosphate isomerase/epimerase
MLNRREFIQSAAGITGSAILSDHPGKWLASEQKPWKLNFMISSCLYGYMDIETILAEVRRNGAMAIDIWPKIHGNQREQLDEMGEAKFLQLLKKYKTSLGCFTQFKLGPFALEEEINLAQRLGAKMIVTGAKGEKGLTGDALRNEVQKFARNLQPTLELADQHGIVIAIENHSSTVIHTPDSIKWFLDMVPHKNAGIAFAPYHLQFTAKEMAALLRHVGQRLSLFYAWQHGKGSTGNMSKADELMQLPGKGPLDFTPLLAELKAMNYRGWTEIFMHSFPRGEALAPTAAEVTAHLNASRKYLETCIKNI